MKIKRIYRVPEADVPKIVITSVANYAEYTANFTPPTAPYPRVRDGTKSKAKLRKRKSASA